MPPSPTHKTDYASEALSLLTSRYQKRRPTIIHGNDALALAPWSVSGAASSAFTPASISGCRLWVRADVGTTIATGVSAWADQSGSGHDLSQANPSQQPTLVAADSLYGNRPVLSSVATQFLASSTWASAVPQPFSIFIVGQCDNSLFYAWDGSTDEASLDFGGLGWRVISDPSNFSASATPTNPTVLIAVVAGASSKLYVSQATPTTGSLGTSALDQAAIFGRQDGGGTGNGKCADAAIYDHALDASEAALLNTYANARYGISIGP